MTLEKPTNKLRAVKIGDIDLIAEELHDPAAPDVTNEMTTLVASGAQVLVAGTTAAFCPQTVGTLANIPSWRPMFSCHTHAIIFQHSSLSSRFCRHPFK